MSHRTYIILKESSGDTPSPAKETKEKKGLYHQVMKEKSKGITEEVTREIKEGIKEYIEKHGYHFSHSLAEFASKQMENANGQKHSWTVDRIKSLMSTHGLELPKDATYGDITYAANMGYADFYPDVLKDEASCLKFAYNMANDPDGYEGMIFKRWCTDIMAKHLDIDWLKYL